MCCSGASHWLVLHLVSPCVCELCLNSLLAVAVPGQGRHVPDGLHAATTQLVFFMSRLPLPLLALLLLFLPVGILGAVPTTFHAAVLHARPGPCA